MSSSKRRDRSRLRFRVAFVITAMVMLCIAVILPFSVQSIVDDGVEGFLFEVGDVPTLTDRLITVLSAPALVHAMGEAARRRAASHDVRQVARELLDALRTAAGTPGSVCGQGLQTRCQ